MDLELQLDSMRKECTSLSSKLELSTNCLSKAEKNLEKLEQYTRRNSVKIFGIPESRSENTDDVVCNLAREKLQLDLSISDIDRSHRVGDPTKERKHPRAIIVKCCSYRIKNSIIRARRKLKGTHITIQEDLTNIRQELYTKTYKNRKVTSCWTADGKIFAIVDGSNGSKVRRTINNDRDLELL